MTQAPASAYHASDGVAYEVFLGRWTARLAVPLLDFAAFAPRGDLLEAGCGTGSLALAMAQRWPGRAVVGCDIATPYIAFARERTKAPPPVFEVADVMKLPYADGRFAGVAAQLVLNFVGDPLVAVSEMRRVARSGGALVAAVWDVRGGPAC